MQRTELPTTTPTQEVPMRSTTTTTITAAQAQVGDLVATPGAARSHALHVTATWRDDSGARAIRGTRRNTGVEREVARYYDPRTELVLLERAATPTRDADMLADLVALHWERTA